MGIRAGNKNNMAHPPAVPAGILACLALLLAACGGQYTKPGAGPADLERDRAACNRDPQVAALSAEYEKLRQDRAAWFDATLRFPMAARRANTPDYVHTVRQHEIASRLSENKGDEMRSAHGDCLRRRGWTYTRS